MTEDHLRMVGTVFITAALIPALGILYTWRKVNYNATTLGRVLHSKSLAIAEVLALSFIAGVLLIFDHGRPVWFELLRLVAFGHVTWALWRQWATYRDLVTSPAVNGEKRQTDGSEA